MVIFHIDLPIKNSDFPIFHSYVNVYQRLPPSHRPPHGLGIIAQRQVWPAVQQHREAQRIGTLHLHVQVPNQGLTWLARRWGGVLGHNWWKFGERSGKIVIWQHAKISGLHHHFFGDLAKENRSLTINYVDFAKKQLYLNKKNDINQETCGFKHQNLCG